MYPPNHALALFLIHLTHVLPQGLLVACYAAAGAVDRVVARAQRRELGLCEECGGLYDAAVCTQQGCPSKAQPGERNDVDC